MPAIEDEFGTIFHGRVKRKVNITGNIKRANSGGGGSNRSGGGYGGGNMAKAGRVARQSTEVMVKVTGWGKSAGHAGAHLDYISRHGKVDVENEKGQTIEGKENIKKMLNEWQESALSGRQRKDQRQTMHMVLSMPVGVEPEKVRLAVRAFAKDQFGSNHEYAFALHTDAGHPHCHLVVKCQGLDGRRLRVGRAELLAYREGFAERMRHQGVDAEASPRRARGVTRTAESQVVRHIERGDATHAPRVSRVRAQKVREAVDELEQESRGKPRVVRPEDEIRQRDQAEVRRSWLAVAAAVESDPAVARQWQAVSALPGSQEARDTTSERGSDAAPAADAASLAARIRNFVRTMPSVKTEREQLREELVKKFTVAKSQPTLPPPTVPETRPAPARPPQTRNQDLDR